MPNRPLRVCLLVVGALLTVSACKARADVGVQVAPDGSGTVTVTGTFDREAVDQIGGDLSAAVRVDDLRSAGWAVTGPAERRGETVISVSKPFRTAAAMGPVLAELGGSTGLFSDWKLTSTNSFTVSSYELTGRIRLSGSLDQFSDPAVASALDGFALGRSPEEIAAALADHPDALTMAVDVRLPGDLDEATGLTAAPGADRARGTYVLGSGAPADVAVSLRSSSTDRSAVLWILVGAGLVAAAALLFVAGRRRPRRSTAAVDPPT